MNAKMDMNDICVIYRHCIKNSGFKDFKSFRLL